MEEFTHLAEIYGFRCWYNENTGELKGVNWLNEKLIDIFIWFDTTFEINDGFAIKIIEEI